MNGAPDWQDGECCFRCRTQFTLVARKHHCRNCGNIFCAKCSSQQIPLPKLNIEKNVRVCDTCYEKISSKNEDPLTLALDSSSKEQPKAKSNNSKSSSSSKQMANTASAPSEQELKEEEELQLALALSLSETPTKVSFPDCRHFEASNSSPNSTQTDKSTTSKQSLAPSSSNSVTQPITNGISSQRVTAQSEITIPAMNSVDQYAALNSSLSVLQQPQQLHYQAQQPVQPQQPEYHVQDRDLEVFRYVGEVQSTLEIFNNRLESCKLRNRPVANDAAVQSMFLKLNAEFQPKLAEYIKSYEDERANYERLQDKLSQIADARAALDALREEYQEKVRQQAAEAERQRQSQLATKLEAMRQKKSEMMQYQRELALQRIRENEMMLQQQQPTSLTGYQMPTATIQTHMMSNQSTFDPMQQMHDHTNSIMVGQQSAATLHQDWHRTPANQQYNLYTPSTQVSNVPNQQHLQQYHNASGAQPTTQMVQQQPYVPPPQPAIDRASINQLERQFLPNSKPEEDEPLISFDD